MRRPIYVPKYIACFLATLMTTLWHMSNPGCNRLSGIYNVLSCAT